MPATKLQVFELTSAISRDSYARLVNRRGVQILDENDFYGIVPGGEGEGSDPSITRVVTYRDRFDSPPPGPANEPPPPPDPDQAYPMPLA